MQVHICVPAGELVEDMNILTHYTKTVQRKQNKRENEEEGCPKNKLQVGQGPGHVTPKQEPITVKISSYHAQHDSNFTTF